MSLNTFCCLSETSRVARIEMSAPEESDPIVECPLCGLRKRLREIRPHAATCNGLGEEETAASPAEPTFGCGLCRMTSLPLSICFRMDECGHPFCRACIERYCAEQVLVSVAVACPNCKAPLSVRDCELLLPKGNPPPLDHRPAGSSRCRALGEQRATGSTDPRRRLMSEFKLLSEGDCEKHGFSISLADDDLFTWKARLFNFDIKTDPIASDLSRRPNGENCVTLSIKFPDDYPLRPPFVRVLQPRLQFMTGHITVGGSVCFEMLTSQGWKPQFTVETLLVSIRANLITGGARVDFSNTSQYSEAEARSAFDRMLRVHGWQ